MMAYRKLPFGYKMRLGSIEINEGDFADARPGERLCDPAPDAADADHAGVRRGQTGQRIRAQDPSHSGKSGLMRVGFHDVGCGLNE